MSNLKMVLAGGSVLWFVAAVAAAVAHDEQGAIISVLCGILFHLWAVA